VPIRANEKIDKHTKQDGLHVEPFFAGDGHEALQLRRRNVGHGRNPN
jgi:hypothetical protein